MSSFQVLRSFANYIAKPGKKILTHITPKPAGAFNCAMEGGVITREAEASLGDASLYIEKMLESRLSGAKEEVISLFSNLGSVQTIQNRSKGALSILTKLKKGLGKASNNTFNNMNDAIKCIEDGIGSRVITKSLNKLNKSQIEEMITAQNLSKADAALLRKYIYQERILPSETDKAFELFEKFATPLVEKRSKEVVDQLTLGILKQRITKGEKLDDLVASGLYREDLMKRLATEDIQPIKITEINNYRGQHGLAEFSNNQIRQLSMAMGDSSECLIISDARGIEGRWPKDVVNKLASNSVKPSGYRTAQMNVVHKNGALGEIQFRGEQTNLIGEYEHIAYDLRKGKDTLGELFEPFKGAVKHLSDGDYAIYNKYLENCYNYYNRIELGLPAVKPKLPMGLPKILSEESLRSLHETDHILQAELKKGFIPHFEAA